MPFFEIIHGFNGQLSQFVISHNQRFDRAMLAQEMKQLIHICINKWTSNYSNCLYSLHFLEGSKETTKINFRCISTNQLNKLACFDCSVFHVDYSLDYISVSITLRSYWNWLRNLYAHITVDNLLLLQKLGDLLPLEILNSTLRKTNRLR